MSCLVEPEPGDVVLLASNERAAWVLAILEREAGAGATLVADGDLEVRVEHGHFGVAAQEGIDLASGGDVEVIAGRVRVNASEGEITVDRFSFLARAAKVVASTVDATIDRVAQRVKRSYRHVEEIDQLRAEQIDYSAKKLMALRAENAVVTADLLVKLDGEQVHVG